mmetsp:Transcript_52989/g.115945  ORF Transcript_52989/g.115945 Transcript_52989/m.115945 type:complete len:127 (+) Transcript_52989:120-500(+)
MAEPLVPAAQALLAEPVAPAALHSMKEKSPIKAITSIGGGAVQAMPDMPRVPSRLLFEEAITSIGGGAVQAMPDMPRVPSPSILAHSLSRGLLIPPAVAPPPASRVAGPAGALRTQPSLAQAGRST